MTAHSEMTMTTVDPRTGVPSPPSADWRRSVWVVMPCYNEDGSLESVLADVGRFGYSIVVVDDGSKVPAASIVRPESVHVLRWTAIRWRASRRWRSPTSFRAEGVA